MIFIILILQLFGTNIQENIEPNIGLISIKKIKKRVLLKNLGGKWIMIVKEDLNSWLHGPLDEGSLDGESALPAISLIGKFVRGAKISKE
jgi:hypothetical protein